MKFGQLFQKFDTDGDGRLGQAEFERMIGEMLEELGRAKKDGENMHPVDGEEGRKLGGEGTNTGSVGKRDSRRAQEALTVSKQLSVVGLRQKVRFVMVSFEMKLPVMRPLPYPRLTSAKVEVAL